MYDFHLVHERQGSGLVQKKLACQVWSNVVFYQGYSIVVDRQKNWFTRLLLAKENIDFWLAVKDFRENESYKEKEKAIEKAYEMYNVYCKEGAEHQVNLPCHMRTNI